LFVVKSSAKVDMVCAYLDQSFDAFKRFCHD